MTLGSLLAVVVVFAGVIVLFKAVRMVPQGYEWTVEAFGKYTHTLTPGLHFLVPIYQGVGRKINMMEQVLEVYRRPYDSQHPVVCMDEQPKQLIEESRPSLPALPGQPAKEDYEYIRHGVCCVWMFVEPLVGWRDVEVTERRTGVDWARQVRDLVDAPRYAQAERITLVCDNLNTHRLTSLYQAFDPAEALRIARKLELVHTPKHGSWLNRAEPE